MKNHLHSFILGLCAACLVLSGRDAFAQEGDGSEQKERMSKTIEQLIDSLANANPEPKCIRHYNERFAIFDPAYDWAEQERVLKTLRELVRIEGNEAWPHLVAHIDDDRYAMTYSVDHIARNISVGGLCYRQASRDLIAAYRQYCPSVKGVSREGENWVLWAPEAELKVGLQEWYRKRMGKALWELQIEMCEWAIEKAPGLERVSSFEKAKFISDVKKEVLRLKKTHEPVVHKALFTGIFFETYTAEKAQKSRERYEKRVKDEAEQDRQREAKKKLDAEAEKLREMKD